MPLAVQYGMPLNDFWHGDIRLLNVYQKAYLRHTSYTAWLNGQYNSVAHSISLANGFATKGQKPKEFPKWKDPVEVMSKPKITKDNIEEEFRKEQARQAGWLHNLLKK